MEGGLPRPARIALIAFFRLMAMLRRSWYRLWYRPEFPRDPMRAARIVMVDRRHGRSTGAR